jgi:hypothetical protein
VLLELALMMAAAKDASFFEKRVAPILKRRCSGCHNAELQDGGISVSDRASLLKGGSRGPAVVPGDPGRSVLVRAIRHDSDPQMPPGPKLTAREIKILIEWVKRGAPMDQ